MTAKCDKCDDTGEAIFSAYWGLLSYCDCPAGEALRKRARAERDNASNRGIDRARERAEERLINDKDRKEG